jgi:monoterpene epsilon-lactone hydrolase
MLDWQVDERPATLYTRCYVAAMWLWRDKQAFEGTTHTPERAMRLQAKGDSAPTPWTRLTRRVSRERHHDMEVWRVRRRHLLPGLKACARARILYLHGGGFVHPLTKDYWRLARALSLAPAEVYVAAYPLAPLHTVDDVLPQLVALAEELVLRSPELPLVLMGDSAGGALSLVVGAQLRDRDMKVPAGIVCLSPWLDVTLGDTEVAAVEGTDPMLAESGLRAAGRLWAGRRSPLDPVVSPVQADLEHLPDIDVFIGDHDILRPAVTAWAERARHSSTTRVTVHEVPAMFHVWMTRAIPEARRTRRQLTRLIRERASARVSS